MHGCFTGYHDSLAIRNHIPPELTIAKTNFISETICRRFYIRFNTDCKVLSLIEYYYLYI